jgi:hypothetical protein
MARTKLRGRREVVARCAALAGELEAALARLPEGAKEPEIVEAIWAGEALGTLLWAFEAVELPPYDRPFESERVLGASLDEAALRPADEIERARETARLWHWRARTALLQERERVELPDGWVSFDQLVAATAMRGHDLGLLPRPLRGDFPAYATDYRKLQGDRRAEVHQIAWERHRALNWLCGRGSSWDDVPTDT